MEFIAITKEIYTQVAQIYQEGLNTGIASFETKSKSWEVWHGAHLTHSRIAVMEKNDMLGWAALSPVSTRAVYAGVAEVSIYISHGSQGKGVGTMLMNALIEGSETAGIWTLQSSIFAQNTSSIALHLKCGFRQIGYRERIAQRDGVWHDNVLFERRSARI